MSKDELRVIEDTIDSEDRPDDVWFIETIESLVDEIRRLQTETKKK